ncbi:barwin-like endoglucanase [Neoconidiobolus thromboides FSU 785]|nr:barwin-like endoglucanase [Neoconidiobolus thromboides FSU 785]
MKSSFLIASFASLIAAQNKGSARYDTNSGYRKCSFPDGTYTDQVFVGPLYYNGAQSCGACLSITNTANNQTVIANVVDQCVGCGQFDLVMSLNTFQKIADPAAGVVNVSWNQIRCPNVQGNIKYSWQSGSNQWWAAVQIQNYVSAVRSLEYKSATKDWTPVMRRDDNFFILSSAGPGPYKFRLTSYDNKVVEDPNVVPLENGGIQTSPVQF